MEFDLLVVKKICNVFERSLLFSAKLSLLDQIYSNNHNNVKYSYLKQHYSGVTWSFRNHSDLLIWCLRNFIIIINDKNICVNEVIFVCGYFCGYYRKLERT